MSSTPAGDEPHPGPPLTGERLLGLLGLVEEGLARRGEHAVLFVVGGAAMALAYDAARSTRDVDALFRPAPVVREVIEEVAAREGLEPDWVNDAAKGFLPGDDPEARTVLEARHLLVQVASPAYLLAMKIHSGREEQDRDDAVRLAVLTGMTRTDQLTGLLERTYPPRLLLPRHRYIAQDVAQRATQASQAQAVDPGTVARVRRVYQAAMPPPGQPSECTGPEEVPPPRPGPPRGHTL